MPSVWLPWGKQSLNSLSEVLLVILEHSIITEGNCVATSRIRPFRVSFRRLVVENCGGLPWVVMSYLRNAHYALPNMSMASAGARGPASLGTGGLAHLRGHKPCDYGGG